MLSFNVYLSWSIGTNLINISQKVLNSLLFIWPKYFLLIKNISSANFASARVKNFERVRAGFPQLFQSRNPRNSFHRASRLKGLAARTWKLILSVRMKVLNCNNTLTNEQWQQQTRGTRHDDYRAHELHFFGRFPSTSASPGKLAAPVTTRVYEEEPASGYRAQFSDFRTRATRRSHGNARLAHAAREINDMAG